MLKTASILPYTVESVGTVVDSLLSEDVVGLPTETVYGLGGIITSDRALRKIFSVKSRPYIDPLIVHVLDTSSLLNLVDIDSMQRQHIERLVDAFCPGPLTFVLRKQSHVSDLITAGKRTVAVRMPNHRAFRDVLRQLSCPIAAPSANPFGYISPTSAQHVYDSIGDKIEYILDGGECTYGLESTILDLSGKECRILRPGAVDAEEISHVLGVCVAPYRMLTSTDPASPGLLKQHYSPRTKLRLFREHPMECIRDCADDIDHTFAKNSTRTGTCIDCSAVDVNGTYASNVVVCDVSRSVDTSSAVIYLSRAHALMNENVGDVYWLSEDGDLYEVAKNLFSLLRSIDNKHYNIIYCQLPDNVGIGRAICDRLTRASAKF